MLLALQLLNLLAAESPEVTVPDVVGLSEAVANASVVSENLLFLATTAYSASVAIGLVISQSPVAGTLAEVGDVVTVVISLGPEPVVPVITPRSRTFAVGRFG
jgi:serine/threonine-protein kinase